MRGHIAWVIATLTAAWIGGCGLVNGLDDFEQIEGPRPGATTGTGGTGGAATSSSSGMGGMGGATTTSSGMGGSSTTSSGMGGSGGMMPTCGDGMVTGSEECDDGNMASKDGCSAVCTYDLWDDCPMGAIPLGSTPLVFNGDTNLANPTSSGNCGGNSAGDYIIAVTLTLNGTLVVTLDGIYQSVVWLRAQCVAGGTVACGTGDPGVPAQITYPATLGSTYYVGVDGEAGSQGPFTLTLQVQ